MADYTVPSTPTAVSPATTFELPNYVGELFTLIKAEVPFLGMAGGLTGGMAVDATQFQWQVEDNVAASATAQAVEGADPTDAAIIRQTVENVVEIHQESVKLSYTKQSATGQLGIAAAPALSILGNQPVTSELDHQLVLKINQIARDVEMSFLNGTYDNPATNGTPRKTRGMLAAITTHTINYTTGAGGKGSAYTDLRSCLNDQLVNMFSTSAAEAVASPLIQPVLFVNGAAKVKLSNDYSNNGALADRSRTVGGVNVETLVTDFGLIDVVIDRYMPTTVALLADMSVVAPCFLPIAGKGHFFAEPLAKTGAYDQVQLYGEIGLKYGPETWHSQITAITY
jgi:hypothetical protein